MTIPDSEDRLTWRARTRVLALAALCSLALAPLVMAAPAGASGGTIGTYTFTGQASGTVKAAKMTAGTLGLSVYGCQVQQESNQILLQVSKPTLVVNGKKTSLANLQITVEVDKDGQTEPLGGTNPTAGVNLVIAVGKKNSEWESTSGTASVKPKGNGATFTTQMVPAGTLSGTPAQSGGAVKSVHLTGSVSSCHPFQ